MTDAPQLTQENFTNLILDEERFSELQDSLDFYCPFDALNVGHAEIRHAAFLVDTMTPHETHGIGSKALQEFVDFVLSETGNTELRLKAHLGDFENATIRREWKNIDIFIHIPIPKDVPLVIAVELKVDAGLTDQLRKYEKTIKNEYESAHKCLVVLAPHPIEQNNENWTSLGMEPLLPRFEKIAKSLDGSKSFRMLLQAYCDLIRRNYLRDNNLEDLAIQIWKKHGPVLDFLMDRKPDAIRDLREKLGNLNNKTDHLNYGTSKFLKDISKNLNFNLLPNKSDRRNFRIAVKEWRNIPILQDTNLKLDWNDSYLVLEMVFEANQIKLKFLIAGGDNGVDEEFYRYLISCKNLNAGGKKTTPQKWAGLTFEKVFPENTQEDDGGTDADYKELVRKTSAYLKKYLPLYDKALRQFSPSSPSQTP